MSNDIKPGYTRVSDFCSMYEDFSSVDPIYLESRALVGTHVHTAIRAHLCGMPTELTAEEQLYFNSWLAWYLLMGKPLITHEETRMYCDKWMLTGAIDGIIHIDGCAPMILDWKTSSSENVDVWSLKGGFYLYLARVNQLLEPLADRVYYLKLDKNGGAAKVCEYDITPYWRGAVTATMIVHRLKEKMNVNKKNWRRT